jgi:hypothetical protein
MNSTSALLIPIPTMHQETNGLSALLMLGKPVVSVSPFSL